MRFTILFAAGALALASVSAVQAADFTLDSYLSKVEADNQDLALARRDLALAEQSVAQARSALLPSVGLQGSYTRNLTDVMKSSAYQADLSNQGYFKYMEADSNFDNEYLFGLGVNQKIFDASAIAGYSQAKKGREVREAALETTRRSIRTAAKKLFAQAELTAAVLDVMETSEKAASENYRSVSLKSQAGVATELDALLAEVDWKSKIPTTAEARTNKELVMIALKNLAGIPLSETVVLSGDSDSIPELPPDVEVSSVLSLRPDFKIALLSSQLADIASKAALGTFLPTVSGSFSWGYVSYSGYANDVTYDTDSSSVGLSVTLPLFTGGYRLSLMKSASIAREQSSIELKKKADSIEREIMGLRLRLSEARTRIDSARVLENATKRAVALANSSFSNGLGTQLQVTDATSKYDQARLNLRNAIYTYRVACYDWDYTVGSPN